MMAFLPLKRHLFKLVDINGTIVIDVSDLYNILEALGASSLEPLPGSQDTLFLPPSLWTDVPSLLYHLLKMKHTHRQALVHCLHPTWSCTGHVYPHSSLFSCGYNSPFVWFTCIGKLEHVSSILERLTIAEVQSTPLLGNWCCVVGAFLDHASHSS